MPKRPAPLSELSDIVDALEEAQRRRDEERLTQIIQQLQTEFSRTDLQLKAGHSLGENGMTRHTRSLIRGMGYRVQRIA